MSPRSKCFIRVTNEQIYKEIRATHDDILTLCEKAKNQGFAIKGLFLFDLALLSSMIYIALS